MRAASDEKAAAVSGLSNQVTQMVEASQALERTLQLNTVVSSLLQVRPSLIF